MCVSPKLLEKYCQNRAISGYWQNKTEEFLQLTFSDTENFKFPAMELTRYTDHKINI